MSMFGIGKGFWGGLLGLFFTSIIVFFIIYLLVPEVSLKFFGISINADKYIEETVEQSLVNADLPESVAADITRFLYSDEGEAFIESMQEAAGGATESVISFLGSDGFQDFLHDAGDFVSAGAGSVSDFFSENFSSLPED